MLRKFFLCAFLFFSGLSAHACDICGCASGASFTGILPQFHKNFVGTRYTYRHFRTSHPTDDGSRLFSHDWFHTADVWGRFYAHRRVQIFAVLPVNQAGQELSGFKLQTFGLGDAQVFANYAVIQTPDTLASYWRQTLLLGGGFKLPTGENNLRRNGERVVQSLQPGTGSWDALMNMVYTLRYKGWGLNADANFRISTTNIQGYKFGNRVNGSLKFFYWAQNGKLSFLPNAGLLADYGMKDTDQGERIRETGGFSMLGTAGMDIYYGRLVLGFTFQQPIAQKIGEGAVSSLQRYSANLAILF